VKAMTKTNSRGFQYRSNTFPNISTAKLKEGIFVGPQIRELLKGEAFVESVADTEQAAWESLRGSVQTSEVQRNLLISVMVTRDF
jgi:hypothetical protein